MFQVSGLRSVPLQLFYFLLDQGMLSLSTAAASKMLSIGCLIPAVHELGIKINRKGRQLI